MKIQDAQDARLIEIIDAIMRYLASHPNAADTVEGIAKWWLPNRTSAGTSGSMGADLELVEAALNRLQMQGLVRRQSNTDRHVLYSAVRKESA